MQKSILTLAAALALVLTAAGCDFGNHDLKVQKLQEQIRVYQTGRILIQQRLLIFWETNSTTEAQRERNIEITISIISNINNRYSHWIDTLEQTRIPPLTREKTELVRVIRLGLKEDVQDDNLPGNMAFDKKTSERWKKRQFQIETLISNL